MATTGGEHGPGARAGGYAALAGRILAVWFVLAASLLALALADVFLLRRGPAISNLYLFQQDIPLLLGAALLLVVLARTRPTPAGRPWSPPPGWPVYLGLAVGAAALAGTWLVFARYPMTVDEFMADFDARIFAGGRLFARVPEAWRPYAGALQPIFVLETPGHAMWASAYLPVNAAARALAGFVGAASLVNPAWTAISVVAVAGVARRLWPERPQAPWIAAVLLATSSQLVVAGMTAYAMPAHLALNLVWLWCFLRGGRLGHAGALATGFLATGLHQLLFHPLFAGPFVLQLCTERRWRAAGLYTAVYAAIGLFWLLYWTAALQISGVTPEPGGGGGVGWFGQRLAWMLSLFDLLSMGSMAKDLLRFVAWQNPLTVPMAVLALAPALKAGGTLRSLALGLGLTVVAIYVLLPYQDHGWGYRYLHGFLGSACLLAAWGWMERTSALNPDDQAASASAFLMAAAASALLLMPFAVWQAGAYLRPYATAHAAIAHADADVVLVDDTGGWYVESLVRNDPDLRVRPRVMKLDRLDAGQIRTLCGAYSVAVFDKADAGQFGIRTLPGGSNARAGRLRTVMADLRCGEAHVASPGASDAARAMPAGEP